MKFAANAAINASKMEEDIRKQVKVLLDRDVSWDGAKAYFNRPVPQTGKLGGESQIPQLISDTVVFIHYIVPGFAWQPEGFRVKPKSPFKDTGENPIVFVVNKDPKVPEVRFRGSSGPNAVFTVRHPLTLYIHGHLPPLLTTVVRRMSNTHSTPTPESSNPTRPSPIRALCTSPRASGSARRSSFSCASRTWRRGFVGATRIA